MTVFNKLGKWAKNTESSNRSVSVFLSLIFSVAPFNPFSLARPEENLSLFY